MSFLSYKTKMPIIPIYIHNIFKGPSKKNWFGRNSVKEGIITLIINKFKKVNIFIGDSINPTVDNIILEQFRAKEENQHPLHIFRTLYGCI